MWAMIVKEFRQLRRDRRTLAMMIFLPILLLVIFGYAARFDVKTIAATVVGPQARLVAAQLRAPFHAAAVEPSEGRADAVAALRDGKTPVAIVTGTGNPTVLLDGSQLFTANAAKAALAAMAPRAARASGPAATAAAPAPRVEVLFNPDLKTSDIMVPGL